jgi:hypothetical protein
MSTRADPATGYAAVTKSDTVALPTVSRALYIGTTGDLVVKSANGAAITFKSVPAGSILPIQATYVMAATTAADIVALF